MSAYSAILATLQDDASLAGILTGGLYDGTVINDISARRLRRCVRRVQRVEALRHREAGDAKPGRAHPDSSRLFVTIWFYQQSGSADIDVARIRAYHLLHRSTVAGSDGLWDVRHFNDLLGIELQALGVPAIMSRYVATVNRG